MNRTGGYEYLIFSLLSLCVIHFTLAMHLYHRLVIE